jgi:hypothetical protein
MASIEVASSARKFPHPRRDKAGPIELAGDRIRSTRALGPSLCLLGNIQDSSQEGSIGAHPPKRGRGAGSLITAEISLIANLNSLQGRKKFPVLMRRELARKDLVWRLFLLPLTRCGASNR